LVCPNELALPVLHTKLVLALETAAIRECLGALTMRFVRFPLALVDFTINVNVPTNTLLPIVFKVTTVEVTTARKLDPTSMSELRFVKLPYVEIASDHPRFFQGLLSIPIIEPKPSGGNVQQHHVRLHRYPEPLGLKPRVDLRAGQIPFPDILEYCRLTYSGKRLATALRQVFITYNNFILRVRVF
jgi:hypothetical protein